MHNKEQSRKYHQEYYQLHKEEVKQKTANYRRQHPLMQRIADRKIRVRYKIEVFTHYSDADKPQCVRCGNDDIDVLTIDHINGGGGALRKSKIESSNLNWWLRKHNYPPGYQILCANCNLKKEIQRRVKIQDGYRYA